MTTATPPIQTTRLIPRKLSKLTMIDKPSHDKRKCYDNIICDQIHSPIILDVFFIFTVDVQWMDPNLYRIEYVQTDGKSFKLWTCTSCEKSFKQPYLLRRHLPVHTDERKYKCDACDKSFNHQLSTLISIEYMYKKKKKKMLIF